MVRRLILDQEHIQRPPFPATTFAIVGLSGISTPFEMLSQSLRQIIYALLTRAPLNERASSFTPFDLHVLGTPPAFVLSQDQTLQFELPVSYCWLKLIYRLLPAITTAIWLSKTKVTPRQIFASLQRERKYIKYKFSCQHFFRYFLKGSVEQEGGLYMPSP